MMRSLTLLASWLAAASVGVEAIKKDAAGAPKRNIVPGAFIFEFEPEVDTHEFRIMAEPDSDKRLDLDFKLFKGASISFKDVKSSEDKANKLAGLPAVKNVWPVVTYDMPKPKVVWAGEGTTPAHQPLALQKRDNVSDSEYSSTQIQTQVDKMREDGYDGTGFKIAVVDTGIDYLHPALGGGFGKDFLVVEGTDFVGDDYTGFNTPVPDDDPIDCGGHGSHVAGIVAAQKTDKNPYDFTGSAPGVKLAAYKVFGCTGSVANDILIAAFNRAYEDGADLITSSIGGASGWSEDPWAVTASRIVEKGVPCTVSAGNDGAEGLFYASTAANGKLVTSVASFDNYLTPVLLSISNYTVDGGEPKDFGWITGSPDAWEGVSLPLWAVSYDTTETDGGCDPYPEDTPDLSGYIVLIRRGSCTFVQKARNAADKGAKYIMIYNNKPGVLPIDVAEVTEIVAAGMVEPETGEKWISLLQDGSEVVLNMVDPLKADTSLIQLDNEDTPGALSDYTSWGPTNEMDLSPQLGAIGGNVLSTYPRAKGSYAVLSGTSMACPQLAAIFALIAQARGGMTPSIENLLAANANPQLFNDGSQFYEFLTPVPQQGGGLAQAYDAAMSKTLLSPSGLSFNDTDNFQTGLNFTLKNTGDSDVTFKISHVPAITMFTLDEDSLYVTPFPNEPTDATASLKFSDSEVTIGAGEEVTVDVMATEPEGLDASRLPLYSGWVAVNGSDGSSLSLPYQGVVGSLHDATVLSGNGDVIISKSTDTDNNPVEANRTFVIPAPGTEGSEDTEYPSLVWYLAMGSPLLRIDVIPMTTCPPNGTHEHWGVKTYGQPLGSPIAYNPRGLASIAWNGQMADGSFAPAGKYKFALHALHIFGDAEEEKEYDVGESPAFRIKYADEDKKDN